MFDRVSVFYYVAMWVPWGGVRARQSSAPFARALQMIISAIYPINFFSIKLIVCKDLKSGRP